MELLKKFPSVKAKPVNDLMGKVLENVKKVGKEMKLIKAEQLKEKAEELFNKI